MAADLGPKTASPPARVFRTPRWLRWWLGIASVGTALGAAFAVRFEGVGWLAIGLAAFSGVSWVGMLDALLTRVELREDVLVVFRNFRRRIVPRGQIDRVTWAAGGPVSVRLQSGDWVHLPDVGNNQSRANSIRAWIRATRP